MKKNKYFKFYVIEISVVILIFLSMYFVLRARTLDIDGVVKSLSNLKSDQILQSGDESTLRKLYYINKNQVEKFVSFIPKSNMDAKEILVLKVKDVKDMPQIKSGIESRLAKQGDSFKNYRPEQYVLIENSILSIEGNNLIFIIAKDASEIKKSIDKNLK